MYHIDGLKSSCGGVHVHPRARELHLCAVALGARGAHVGGVVIRAKDQRHQARIGRGDPRKADHGLCALDQCEKEDLRGVGFCRRRSGDGQLVDLRTDPAQMIR